jgi:asparagine synthase (glutamine-hydrolysing)
MDIYEQLRNKIGEAVDRNRADGILLSGGLDTSILAFIGKPKIAFTVALKGSQASDLYYSEKVSRLLGMEHKKMEFTSSEAFDALPEVIGILKTFDLALPNDLSIYFALKLAKENNVSAVMTGDGSDELFAGYSYMASLSPGDLESYIRRLSGNWHFSANDLGEALDVEIRQPFLDEPLVRFALEISPEFKVRQGTGKYILRKSFEDLMPQEIIWRKKEPIEHGSGSNELRDTMSSLVSDEEFRLARERTGIRFINKEHFFYYRVYEQVVGQIPKAQGDEKSCPCCGARIYRAHCSVCGSSPSLREYLSSLR